MRRLGIVVATVVACAGLAGQTSLAYAEGSGSAPAASSCSDVIKKYKGFNDASQKLLTSNPGSLQKLYRSIARALNKLASSGPSELRASFKHLAQYVGTLAHLDFSNTSSVEQFARSAQQLQPDLRKISQYFGSVCHYTSSTT
jgi:hypothetical protein